MSALLLLLAITFGSTTSIVVHYEQDFYLVESTFDLLPHWLSCTKIEQQSTRIMGMTHIQMAGKTTLLNSLNNRLNRTKEQIKLLTHGHDLEPIFGQSFNINPYKNAHLHLKNMEEAIRIEKRNVIGEAWHYISGAPGPTEYAMEQKNLHKIEHVLNEQRTSQKSTADDINLIKENEMSSNKHLEKVEKELTNMAKTSLNETIAMDSSIYLMTYHATCSDYLDEIQIKLNELKIAKAEAENRKLSKLTITPAKLSTIINEIHGKTRKLTPIYNREQIDGYYSLKSTRVYRKKSLIKFFTRIPLVDPSSESTLKVISTKTKKSTGTEANFILEREKV